MNIAVWYHVKIDGCGIPDPDYGLYVASEQLTIMRACGLSDAASEIHVGINGSEATVRKIAGLIPDKAQIHIHGERSTTEIPTMSMIRGWSPGHRGWLCLYHHTKGVTHPWDLHFLRWRNRMQVSCVINWRRCVADLESGNDIAGCHWIPPQGPPHTGVPFFGGTFWWARCDYLNELSTLPEPKWENRYCAEDWIGTAKRNPKVVDYRPGWP